MAMVCISRQFGAGGRTLAGRVAKRLGYEFADTELTRRVAQATGASDEWVKVTEREAAEDELVSGLFPSSYFEQLEGKSASSLRTRRVVDLFTHLIPEIAGRGNIVFLGRGCQFILPDDPTTIKVLLVAPLEWRIGFMVAHHHLDRDEARETVRDWDVNRTSFLKKLSNLDPDDPKLYDLAINTSTMHLDWAEAMICDLVRRREKHAV